MSINKLAYIIIVIGFIQWGCQPEYNPPEILPPVTLHPDKPNIIFIVGDDIGYEIPSINGGQSYATPNLDNMAGQGIRFTQCYASPYCSPSRTMLLTGKYSFRNYFTWGILNTDQKTIGNMLKNNGYKTLYAGKWQLDGGESSIKKFGFDQYTVFLPFRTDREDEAGSRYKNPAIYTNGNFLSAAQVENKYSDDIFADSVTSFVKQNLNMPFFVYYAMDLCHTPFSPTPADNAFVTWDPDNDGSRTKFFPGMVNYMDRKIGDIINLITKYGIDKETIVIFVGDNGTSEAIESSYDGTIITGGKGTTITYGTHVPLFAYWPGKIIPGKVSEDLIDFTDFMPTLANISNTPMPTDYGPLDGHSFYNSLTGVSTDKRDYVFCHFFIDTAYHRIPSRWVQNDQYKLYEDNKGYFHAPGFYNLQSDIMETNPLTDGSLTPEEQALKNNFQHALDSLQ